MLTILEQFDLNFLTFLIFCVVMIPEAKAETSI